MSTLDPDILATLTPEEQEAIQSNDYSEQDISAIKALAAQASDAGDQPDDDSDESDDDSEPDAGEAQSAAMKADEPAPHQPSSDNEPRAPVYRAELPADFEGRIKALDNADDAAQDRFDEGEIDAAELRVRRADIRKERDALTIAQAKAEIAREMQQQSSQSSWESAVNTFLDGVSASVDYRKDAEKAADLDDFLRKLASNPAHNDKSMNWFLAEAHRRVQVLHGMEPDARKADAAPQAKVQAPKRAQTPLRDAPVTLAHVPGGDGPGDVAGEFGDVLKLEGYELEDALARMSPAQRERFARAN